MNTKQCTKCNRLLSFSDFHSDKQKSDGKCPQCKTCKIQYSKARYQSHKLKINKARRMYHSINSETVNISRRKHPGVAGRGKFNQLNPTHFDFGASLRKPYGESSFARLVRQYKANASRRGLEFCISKSDIRRITQSNCNYCGAEPKQIIQDKTSNGSYIYNGIDRLNSDNGYTPDNCVAACKYCNKAKSNMTQEQWNEWLDRLITFHTTAANVAFKKTIKGDHQLKSASK